MLLVTGARGQLGTSLKKIYTSNSLFLDRNDLDISNLDQVMQLKEKGITNIINTAAYTNVDQAEIEQEQCYKTNVLGVKNLAFLSKNLKIPMIHISTDYIFGGKTNLPYIETTSCSPINIYGKSKLQGEECFLQYAHSGVIIRTSWIFSYTSKNFVTTIYHLLKNKKQIDVVSDQIGAPTYSDDLANIVCKILKKLPLTKEIYHFTNEGVASWYDLAYEIVQFTSSKCKVNAINTSEYSTMTQRPLYSVLNKAKIKKHYNIKPRHWKEALYECLKKIS